MVSTVERNTDVDTGSPPVRRRGRMLRRVGGLVLVGVLLAVLPLLWVQWATTDRIHARIDDVPERRVALVFGAGIYRDGTLTPFLQDRVDSAIDLYRAGKVRKLLMSGDNSTRWHDEVTAMKRYAVARGVDPADVTLDYAGFDTYDSCYRAKAIFGVREAILVTTDYHLPRAVYICNALGLSAEGFGPSEGHASAGTMARYQVREFLGQYEALLETHLLRRKPHFLGPKEPSP